MPHHVKNVCIIDDDNIYVKLVSKIINLQKLSEKVLIFNNGKEALHFFLSAMECLERKDIPQVILLDLNMPVMDGWEFLREFSKIKNKICKNIELYVVSSSIDIRDIDRAKSIDIVSDYFTKPIKRDDFQRLLT